MSVFEPIPVDVNNVDAFVEVDSAKGTTVENKSTANSNNKRLYINNISYDTSEDDLKELLKEFDVLSILIPSQTVRRFKSAYQKSLGIAYVEFESEEQVSAAKELIDGQKLHDRLLRAKPYLPYTPKKLVKRSRSKFDASHYSKESDKPIVEAQKDEDKLENESQVGRDGVDVEKSNHADDEIEVEAEVSKPENPVSGNTVYIGRLSPKVSDGDLREFFHEYGPTDVYIFKSRFKRKSKYVFRSHHVSALVTLKEQNAIPSALEALQEKRLKGKKVDFKPAYLSKIDEVKKAAEVRAKKLQQAQQEASGAARTASNATTVDAKHIPGGHTEGSVDYNGNRAIEESQ